jgi:hypothetical protein
MTTDKVPQSQLDPKMREKVVPIPIFGGLYHDYQYAA